jgi:dihydrofolate synthase / folylpolyglutamate synthase
VNYPQALAWLYDSQQRGIKLGLENIRRLLDTLGVVAVSNLKSKIPNPKFIHVAGTNGKGSVCAMIDAILRAAGVRAGLFTSPHLVTFRERIRIDGAMISEEDVRDGLLRIRQIISGWETHPTFFEITTALALDYFQNRHVDVVVLETGLGGRLDATNTVTPDVSVIAAIDLDHQAWLGSTLRDIAAEKAGIIKPGVPVVSAAQQPEAAAVLREIAAKENAPLHFVTGPLADFPVALAGSHQRLNAALAVAALRAANIAVSDDAIRSGLAHVSWPGRFHVVGERIVLDGAHNEAAATCLARTWREIHGAEKATLVLGVLKDKDVAAVCRALLPIATAVVTTPVRSPRTSSVEEVREMVHAARADIECTIAADLASALGAAKAKPHRILVAGSLFLVGEALALLEHGGRLPEMSAQ